MYKKVELKNGFVGMEHEVAEGWKKKDIIKKLEENEVKYEEYLTEDADIVLVAYGIARSRREFFRQMQISSASHGKKENVVRQVSSDSRMEPGHLYCADSNVVRNPFHLYRDL